MTNPVRKKNLLLLTAMVGALSVTPIGSASAQNLLETLFGRPKQRVVNEFPPPPPPAQPKKVVKQVPKVSAPSYANYRPDPLVRIDFSKLLTTAAVGDSAAATPVGIAQKLAALPDLKLTAEKPVAQAIVDWYSANPDPIWLSDGKPNERATTAQAKLADAAKEALLPQDYAVSMPVAGAGEGDLLRFEVELTARALRYIRDARGGRINPNRISGYYDFPEKPVDYAAKLAALSATQDVAALLAAEQPGNREYRLLRDELASLEQQAETSIQVDAKLLLKPGESSQELPKLVELIARGLDDELGGAFGEVLYNAKGVETYGEQLVPVVKAVQKRAGLKDDGVIGPRTVKALAGESKADRIQKVRVAMEQMRWMPDELGATHVFINQPAFTAVYVEGGEEKLSMRTVIGRTTNQTSFFYDEIKFVDFNPYWGVPQSILVNEMLPRLRNDPGYLDRAGYEVFNAQGKKIPSSSVDWSSYGGRLPYNIRQTPGEANALGELKIMFPNKHAIYMHDTPQKALFNRDERAFSHGCIRLSDPRGMAAAVLDKPVSHVEAMLAKGHSSEKVTRKIPVYVAYFTAWPNKDGVVEYFGDVYGRDTRLLDAIGKTEQVRAPSV